MRARLIGASRLWSKWDRLQFLLSHIATNPAAEREPLDAAIRRWVDKANQSFVPARPDQKLDIRRAIETARARHPSRIWEKILQSL